jgi:hypothetical protein
MWALTEPLAAKSPDSVVLGTFIESLNQAIDVENARLAVGIYGRLPNSVIDVLLFGGVLSTFVLGFHAGLGRRRNVISTVLFVVVLSAVVTCHHLDRPSDGFISVSQRRP